MNQKRPASLLNMMTKGMVLMLDVLGVGCELDM
jgi:hypothetical protein